MVKRNRIINFVVIVILMAVVIGTTVMDVTSDLKLGLDLQGGVEILYEVEPINEEQEINASVLQATVESLTQRVDVLGVSEPNFTIEEPNRIRVQLAGLENEDAARELLQTSAQLSFRDVEGTEYLSGADLIEGGASQQFDHLNKPVVSLQLKDGSIFGDATRTIFEDESLPNMLVIWMDYEEGDSFYDEIGKENPKFISAPSFDRVLNEPDVQIDGGFTVQSARQLADILNAGSLPVNLNEAYSTSVSAQFGLDALNETIIAGAFGILFIFIFMLAVYRFPGLISIITLTVYIYLVLLVFGWMNGVLTLPGIAALILGVGMAVDANIITYERLKEELILGKTPIAAFEAANKNSFSSILDANVTTLIAAGVLFAFGTSTVKGFATLLIVSIVLSFITSVFLSRFLLGLWVKSGFLDKRKSWFGLKESQVRDVGDTSPVETTFFGKQFDFVKHWKKFAGVSLILVIIGVISLIFSGLNLGVDFTSGSRVEITTAEQLEEVTIIEDFENIDLTYHSISYSGSQSEIAVIRFDEPLEQGVVVEIRDYFEDNYEAEVNVSTVSPVVGRELALNALKAILYAAIFIVIYVAIRFELYFAVTAIIALLHDGFMVLVFFSLFQIEFDATIIAAILTIVGYSINDTIITFDRIRENLKREQRVRSYEKLKDIVNDSLMQTFTRSINTGVTIIVAAVLLHLFGASAIANFSLALVIGLLAGVVSSMFIAAQLWLVWRGKNIKENPIVYVKRKKIDGPQV